METKTDHMRRMRLRHKYWRVTPTSERITINPKKGNVMSKPTHYVTFATGITVERDGPDPKDAAARAMLAALRMANDAMGSDALPEARAAVRAAIAQAEAAGIGEEG